MDQSIQDNPYRPAALELRGWGYRHAYRNHFYKAIAATGALDRFASGRDIRMAGK